MLRTWGYKTYVFYQNGCGGLVKEDHALWKDVIISKYGQTEQWTTNTVTNTCGVSVWRTIRNLWPKLSSSIGYKVGEGTRVLFWKDKWIGQNSLMEDFPDLLFL